MVIKVKQTPSQEIDIPILVFPIFKLDFMNILMPFLLLVIFLTIPWFKIIPLNILL
jgi:hypothetical protein